MSNYDLSVLIPARNEEFLVKTVEDILAHKEGKTEVLVGLDGHWPPPPGLAQHPDLNVFYTSVPYGQRGMTNRLCRLSRAKYVMKCDAHCSFDQGFDVKLMADMQDDWTVVPMMYNLHVFDWVCPGGHRRYQGPSGPCTECGKPTEKDILWKPRWNRCTWAYHFDHELHFQYSGGAHRSRKDKAIVESMSLLGACWMLTREKYWELNICDEKHGSWGQQGTEVACKTWLSGGKLMINCKTWFSHMFRTQGGDFSFPYEISGKDQERARKYSRKLWLENRFDKQIYPLSWLVEKFKDTNGWTEEQIQKIKSKVV